MTMKMVSAALLGAMSLLSVTGQPAAAADKNILMVLWKEGMEADQVFKSTLADLGVDASFQEINARQDRAALAGQLRGLEGDIANKVYDAVYTYGTVGTQLATSVVGDHSPVVFNIVFNPVAAKLVQSLETPGVPVTGVTNGVPVADQLDTFNALTPIKKLLVLYNVREPNSVLVEKDVAQWAEENGVTVVSSRVAPGTDTLTTVLADVASGKIDVDSCYAGADSYLASAAKEVHAAIGDKVHLYGGTQTYVAKGGWLATYAPHNRDMGATAAEQMAKVLAGADPATLPVLLPEPRLFISQAAAAQHGVTPPADAALED